jgi:hypothetical protein
LNCEAAAGALPTKSQEEDHLAKLFATIWNENGCSELEAMRLANAFGGFNEL